MRISLADSSATGFKKWSDAHPAMTVTEAVIRAAAQDLDIPAMITSQYPHRPWLVPGVGGTL
jgi:hypothetical protein